MADFHEPLTPALPMQVHGNCDCARCRRIKCRVCDDTGWVPVELPYDERKPHRSRNAVAACLCIAGVRLVNSDRLRARSIQEFWTPMAIMAAFPEGTAAAVERATRERLTEAGLSPVMQGWTLESYRDVVVKDDRALNRYALYAGTWISSAITARTDVVMFGTNGTGKTGLGVSMLRGAFDAGHRVLFVTARDLLVNMRASFDKEGPGEREIEAKYLTPDVLMIDELGGTNQTQYARDVLTAILDARQQSNKATILTMNVTKPDMLDDMSQSVESQLAEILGPRLADRLSESAQFWSMLGESKRAPRKRTKKLDV